MDWFLVPLHGEIIALVVLLLVLLQRTVYMPLLSGQMKIIVVQPTGETASYWRHAVDGHVTVKGNTYNVTKAVGTILHNGIFRTPTSYYTYGITQPRDMLTGELNDNNNAVENHYRTESHVIRDMFHSDKMSFDPLTMVIIIVVTVIIASASVGYYLNNKIEKLTIVSSQTTAQPTVPILTPTPFIPYQPGR